MRCKCLKKSDFGNDLLSLCREDCYSMTSHLVRLPKMRFTLCNLIFVLILLKTVTGDLDVFIFGGTGDLAKRYLWKSFFTLFRDHPEENMKFYAVGRSELQNPNDGNVKLSPFQKILQDCIDCVNDTFCERDLGRFVSKSLYKIVKTEKDFNHMCMGIKSNTNDVTFYFSVPPTAYEKIVEMIVQKCNMKQGDERFKFVFEKPFGSDKESAVSLSNMLDKYLDESQIYRVDHYLGKETVHKILEFRRNNVALEQIMNRNHVKSIEISVFETVGCKGRASYYDKSGVLRDMLQSHLTELLCLLTMDVSHKNSKLHLLRNISTIPPSDVFLAQYTGYSSEVLKETGLQSSNTPTFAVVQLRIANLRWFGVPTILSSGKQMHERNGYCRITFKNLPRFKDIEDCPFSAPQLIFIIRHASFQTPAILVSKQLPVNDQYTPSDWHMTSNYDDMMIFGNKGKCFRIYIPTHQENAYSYLIGELYRGNKEKFIQSHSLLESWRIWSPVVKATDSVNNIIVYKPGSTMKDILKLRTQSNLKICLISNLFLMKSDL